MENNLIHTPEARKVAYEYLYPLKQAGGRYTDPRLHSLSPLMADVLQDVVGNDVTLISSAEEIARGGAKELFTSQNLLTPPLKEGTHRFFCQW